VKVVESAVAHIGPAYSEQVEPSLAGEAIERGLANQRDDGLHEELLSAGQKRAWDFLHSLPAGGYRLEVPAQLREPPVVARDLVRQEGERLRTQAGLSYISTTLDGVVERIDRLEHEVKDVANDLTQAMGEARTRTAEAESRAESAETSLRSIQGSRRWRMTAPFRRLGATWRDR